MPENKDQITLQVDGMDCNNCALSITRKLEKNKDLEQVSVNFATGEAFFTVKSPQARSQAIAGIESLGYKVVSKPVQGETQSGLGAIEKKFLFSLVFTLPLFVSHMFFSHEAVLNNPYVQLGLCLPVFILGLLHFGTSAFKSVLAGFPNMDVLIAVGSSSAFIYSLAAMFLYSGHELHNYLYFETTASIICIVLLGNLIEKRSVKRTTTAIKELSELQPLKVNKVLSGSGSENASLPLSETIQIIDFVSVRRGDILAVNTGDRIPVDGEIIRGYASLDESMITGESLSVEKSEGDKVVGGTILARGQIRMRAEQVGEGTVLSKIISMVKHAQESKPGIQKLGDQVSAIFVPAVLIISVITFFIRHYFFSAGIQEALMNSVAVLVISCPCAMGLATPTAVMVGIGRAARKGILIKGGSTLEAFAGVRQIVFDKTGTLSTGKFRIGEIKLLGGTTAAEAKHLLYHLELFSSHPIAKSLVKELKATITGPPLNFVHTEEEKGLGLKAQDAAGNTYAAGSWEIAKTQLSDTSFQVYLMKNNTLIAAFKLEDELKPGSVETIAFLKSRGITSVLLSGDTAKKCNLVASQTGIEKVYSQATPARKVELITELEKNLRTAMFGDGVNDAPALAKATVGISISNATQVAIQQAQIVLLNTNDLSQLTEAWLISKHTLQTIKQNLFWAFIYNIIAIPIAAAGLLSPMIAAFSMAFSDIIVIGNSIRLRNKKLS
jgi:Cu+-exporting ATPase